MPKFALSALLLSFVMFGSFAKANESNGILELGRRMIGCVGNLTAKGVALVSEKAAIELHRKEIREEALARISDGQFRLRLKPDTQHSFDNSGPGIAKSSNIHYQIPDIDAIMSALGFWNFHPKGLEDFFSYKTYASDIQFGSEQLQMQVRVQYDSRTQRSDAVYERSDIGSGRIFMGIGHRELSADPVAVEIRLINIGDWKLSKNEDDFYSYPTLTKRARLAVDQTRKQIGKFRKNGIEHYSNSDVMPSIDMDVFPGFSPKLTDFISAGVDSRGHFLLYIHNLKTAIALSIKDYEKSRAQTPRYRRIFLRENSLLPFNSPKDGEPYALE